MGLTWLLFLACLTITTGNPRPQLDGGFWWQQGPKRPTQPPTTKPTTAPPKKTEERIVNTGGQGSSQQQYDGSECKCVPYFQCDNGQIITDGTGIIDIRLGPNDQDTTLVGGNCPNILDVCCKPAGIHVTTTPPPIYSSTHSPASQYTCGTSFGGIDEDYDNSLDIDIRIHLNKSLHNFDNVAQFGRYPWMTAILQKKRGGSQLEYKCGGSLIHPQVVLTAAHCVDNVRPRRLKVRLGEWDTHSQQDHPQYKHADYDVSKIILHEYFQIGDRKKVYEDIALLFLEEEAALQYHINPVCLPQPGQSFVGQRCYATGWGRSNFGKGGEWQAILKEIDLPILDRHSCQNRFKETRLRCRFCLHDTFLCAGGEAGKDTCEGDGGSPLVCFDEYGVGVQVGIVAWGIGCGKPIPAAYVDVARYIHWIDHTISNYFQKSTSYFNYNWNTAYIYEGDQELRTCEDNLYEGSYNCFRSSHRCERLQAYNRGNRDTCANKLNQNPYNVGQNQG